VAFDVYESDGPTILLMPTWSIVHSRHWKAQIPYLARHFRVITFDGRGNGRSDRPRDPDAYSDQEFIADAIAVLDATQTVQVVVAGVSMGGHWAAMLAGLRPDRILGAILIGAVTSLVPVSHPQRTAYSFDVELTTDEGWAKYNRHYWRRDYPGFAEFFFSQVFSEAHSTKQREDAVSWALDTDPETLIYTHIAESITGDAEREVLGSIRCPVLVIHGTDDQLWQVVAGIKLAEATGADLLLIEGGGHLPQARDPVRVNLAMKEFVDRISAPAGARA
jgi:pimeloyl-ACP methyl ester carboxylesterase